MRKYVKRNIVNDGYFFFYKVKFINYSNKNIDIYLFIILCIVLVFVKIINKNKVYEIFNL